MLPGWKFWQSFIVSSLVITPLSPVKFCLSSDLSSFDIDMSKDDKSLDKQNLTGATKPHRVSLLLKAVKISTNKII